jgi:hypothetical protein
MRTEIYSLLRAIEGGIGQRQALFLLHDAGIKAKAATSIYVGQTAVAVTGNKRTQRKASRILYGK